MLKRKKKGKKTEISFGWFGLLRWLVILLTLAALAVFLIHSATAMNQDLGRHLKTGQIIWETKSVPKTNLFSYTEPDRLFVNHHWLSEVIYYLLYLKAGIPGLIVLNALLILASFTLVWRVAYRRNFFIVSTLAAFLSVGLVLERTDVRPEAFGFLLFALFIFILDKNREKISWSFWLLIPLQWLWVNLHISFCFGLALMFLFFLDRVWARRRAIYLLAKNKKLDRYIAYVILAGLLMGAVCFINPNTWRGALYPLTVFTNYGYTIVENQSPFFLETLMDNPTITFFKVTLAALIGVFIFNLGHIRLFYLLGSILLVGLSWGAIRNFPFLGLVALPVLVGNFASARHRLGQYFVKWEGWWLRGVLRLLTFGLIFVILITSIYSVVSNRYYLKMTKSERFGLAVPTGAGAAVDFLKQNKIAGPMFNNFDIGSYLIWRLYPEYKVFVDGRPEAYSADFLQSVYIPMQSDEATWRRYADEVYKINFIFFAHTDTTPWAQSFMQRIVQDKDWTMVYLDPTAMILVRNAAANQALIERFALSQEKLVTYLEPYLRGQNFSDLIRLGALAQVAGFNDLATQAFKQALSVYQGAKQIWLASGLQAAAAGQNSEAENYFKKALALDSDYIEAYLALGKFYYQQGNFSEARLNWQRVLEIDSANEPAKNYLDNMGLIPFSVKGGN